MPALFVEAGIFKIDEIVAAHRILENSKAQGKLVVLTD